MGYLGGGAVKFNVPKNQTVCHVSTVFIEPAGYNYALGFLLWSLTPTQAGLASTHTVGYFLGGDVVVGTTNQSGPAPPTQCVLRHLVVKFGISIDLS